MNIFITMLIITIIYTVIGCGTAKKESVQDLSTGRTNYGQTSGKRSAEIKGVVNSDIKGIYIIGIDGRTLDLKNSEVIVEPGSHLLDFKLYKDTSFGELHGDETITINAESGHQYIADGLFKDGRTFIWVKDKRSDDIVAGEYPF